MVKPREPTKGNLTKDKVNNVIDFNWQQRALLRDQHNVQTMTAGELETWEQEMETSASMTSMREVSGDARLPKFGVFQTHT